MAKHLPRREFLTLTTAAMLAAGMSETNPTLGQPEKKPEAEPPKQQTNDTRSLTPKTKFNGPALTFDFPALHLGVAEYTEGPTGCTVLHFPKGATGAVDVRGGSPGTFMAADGYLDALCFAGGSCYGLEAATGVQAELFAQRNYSTGWLDIAVVRGAIIFDYRPRVNAIYPDKALGRAALKAAQSGTFPLGSHGAGCSATVGKGFGFDEAEAAGQGGAFRKLGRIKVAVFTVVNAIGGIVNRQGQVVRGQLNRKTGKRHPLTDGLERRFGEEQPLKPPPGNTTLTAVVTNQKLDSRQLTQLRDKSTVRWRSIQPFHALEDGDVLFAVTTNEVEGKAANLTALGVLASELAWDAVLHCFHEATP